MRDVKFLPFDEEVSLVVASDNSGSVGMKTMDEVQVPYETVAYYSFRVAVMECMAAGANPISVVLHNFCGNEAWDALVSGVQKGLSELEMQQVEVIGSTESNFSMSQSAVGTIVLGKKPVHKRVDLDFTPDLKLAVIGLPLVGEEVIIRQDKVAALTTFKELCLLNDLMIWPVGSKGILFELNQMFEGATFNQDSIITELDVLKSSGPSTCFIVAYSPDKEPLIKGITGDLFSPIQFIY